MKWFKEADREEVISTLLGLGCLIASVLAAAFLFDWWML